MWENRRKLKICFSSGLKYEEIKKMKFSEIDFMKIRMQGYDKVVVYREGALVVGGKIENMFAYLEILKNKKVVHQYGDIDVWMIEIKD